MIFSLFPTRKYVNFWELFFETKFPGHIVARESHFFDQLLETRGGRGALKGRGEGTTAAKFEQLFSKIFFHRNL